MWKWWGDLQQRAGKGDQRAALIIKTVQDRMRELRNTPTVSEYTPSGVRITRTAGSRQAEYLWTMMGGGGNSITLTPEEWDRFKSLLPQQSQNASTGAGGATGGVGGNAGLDKPSGGGGSNGGSAGEGKPLSRSLNLSPELKELFRNGQLGPAMNTIVATVLKNAPGALWLLDNSVWARAMAEVAREEVRPTDNPDNPVGKAKGAEEFIPVWSGLKDSLYYAFEGKIVLSLLNFGLAATDVFAVKALAEAAAKGIAKLGGRTATKDSVANVVKAEAKSAPATSIGAQEASNFPVVRGSAVREGAPKLPSRPRGYVDPFGNLNNPGNPARVRQLYAERIADEAARVAGVDLNKLVDKVLYDKDLKRAYAEFSVTAEGERVLLIGPRALEQVTSFQVKAAVHEILHAKIFAGVLKEHGDDVFRAARASEKLANDAGKMGMYIEEALVESEALRLTKRFYAVEAAVEEHSKFYVASSIRDAGHSVTEGILRFFFFDVFGPIR